jgi:hypothetical protein
VGRVAYLPHHVGRGKPQFDGAHGRLGAIRDRQFADNALYVYLDRTLAYRQCMRDLLVGLSCGQELKTSVSRGVSASPIGSRFVVGLEYGFCCFSSARRRRRRLASSWLRGDSPFSVLWTALIRRTAGASLST